MRKIAAGVLLAILVVVATPAYAQTNTELLRTIHDTARDIARDMDNMLRSMNALLDDLRDVLDDISGIVPMVEQNSESLANIEAAIMGQACGEGTTPVAGTCVADIIRCDAEVVDGVCMASISCGEGTLLHVDTCIADISISYCGEGTVFAGGVCVADPATPATPPAGTPGTAPDPATADPGAGPTIVQPAETNRYVADGDTIRVAVNGDDTEFDLAFAAAPGLSEAGGRDAVLYLDDLCGDQTTPIQVTPQTGPAVTPKAIVKCGGIDASWALVTAGHASFDSADCEIRDFLNVGWTYDRCNEAAAPEPAQTAPTTPTAPTEPATAPTEPATTPATPTTPTTPATPAQVEPIKGVLTYRDFVFPVTVADIVQWPTDSNGDPMTTAEVSCIFPHTPVHLDINVVDNSAGVYTIDTTPDYADGNRHGTSMTLTTPSPPRQLFNQQFQVGGGGAVVYDRQLDLLSTGAYDSDYSVSMLITDWDDATWTDTNDPPVPTAAELAQTVLTLDFRVLSDITNIDCSMEMAGVAPGATNPQPKRLLGLAATAPEDSALLDIVPYDVTCRETITVTAVGAATTEDFISAFSTVSLVDTASGEEVVVTLGDPPTTGLSFRTAAFTIGDGDRVAPADRDRVSLDGVTLLTVEYSSAMDDPCVWTERTS